MRIVGLPVLLFSASSPLLLPNALQLVSVRSALPEPPENTSNPKPHSDAVQLLIHPVAVPVPMVPTNTPAPPHSVNRESCAKRLAAKVPLGSTSRPKLHL